MLRSARWQRNGVEWSCFTKEVDSKMENLPKKPNLSLRIAHFSDILTSAVTTYVGNGMDESWKDLLHDAMSNSDEPNMWKVIQGLNGTPDANSPMKLCHTIVALSPSPKPKLTFS